MVEQKGKQQAVEVAHNNLLTVCIDHIKGVRLFLSILHVLKLVMADFP